MSEKKHSNFDGEKDIFRYYKCFSGESIVSDDILGKEYEEELLNILNEKEKCSSLSALINKIIKTDPFGNGYVARDNYKNNTRDRINLKNQLDKVGNHFDYYKKGKKGSNLEQMIQRHIMLSNKYEGVFGKNLYYEFPCNTYKENTAKDKKGKIPIDLITYDESKKRLYLIELKKCCAVKNNEKISNNLKESNELALRALMEITTYYSFFIHNMKYNKEKMEEALNKVGNVNINLNEVEIRRAILVPKNTLNKVYTKELKEELNKIDCFTIEIAKDDISKDYVNSTDKLFNIEPWSFK